MNIRSDDTDAIDITAFGAIAHTTLRCCVGRPGCVPYDLPIKWGKNMTYASWFAIARPVDKHTQSSLDIAVCN